MRRHDSAVTRIVSLAFLGRPSFLGLPVSDGRIKTDLDSHVNGKLQVAASSSLLDDRKLFIG
jgi:hypothetical protein